MSFKDDILDAQSPPPKPKKTEEFWDGEMILFFIAGVAILSFLWTFTDELFLTVNELLPPKGAWSFATFVTSGVKLSVIALAHILVCYITFLRFMKRIIPDPSKAGEFCSYQSYAVSLLGLIWLLIMVGIETPLLHFAFLAVAIFYGLFYWAIGAIVINAMIKRKITGAIISLFFLILGYSVILNFLHSFEML